MSKFRTSSAHLRAKPRAEFGFALGSPLGRITEAGLCTYTYTGSMSFSRFPLRSFHSYALAYSVDGQAHYRDVNGLEQDIHPGDVIFVFPDLPHNYSADRGETWSQFYLIFEGPLVELWRKQGLLAPGRPILHREPVHYWLRRFESVLGAPREPGQPGFAPPLLELSRLQQVIAELLVGGPRAGAELAELNAMSRACTLLEAEVSRRVPVATLARRLGLSYPTFQRRFVELIGVSPARYRSARLIERACHLMRTTTLADKQIAAKLGFSNEFYFSRRFKQITGLSPRAFKRTLP
ncbi:MAG TPA: AraC family transcriptional regulator [Polyangiaceae bacterium]